jgi:hypothetical protein
MGAFGTPQLPERYGAVGSAYGTSAEPDLRRPPALLPARSLTDQTDGRNHSVCSSDSIYVGPAAPSAARMRWRGIQPPRYRHVSAPMPTISVPATNPHAMHLTTIGNSSYRAGETSPRSAVALPFDDALMILAVQFGNCGKRFGHFMSPP